MSSVRLELVIATGESTHQGLVRRLRDGLAPDEILRTTPWQSWTPDPGRSPDWDGEQPVVLLLAADRWLQAQLPGAPLPGDALVLVELRDGSAQELCEATAAAALLRGDPAVRFGVCRFAGSQPGRLRCAVQFTMPGLTRWREHQRRCLEALADDLLWWLRLCQQRQQFLPIAPIRRPLTLLPAAPLHLRQRLQVCCGGTLGSAWQRWQRRRSGPTADWQIAIGRLDRGAQQLQLLHHLPPSGADWFADPSLVADGSRLWMFCERWHAAAGKGVIDLFEVRPDGLRACGSVIKEPFHLSFPRVLKHRGQWFATVESSSVGEVRLYRAEAFPGCWRLERVLLRGDAWIDPILLTNPDGCWLLVNAHHCSALPGYIASELQVFHSSDLLQGLFRPHPCSPVLVDSSCGRNGGLLNLDGCLIRVGQSMGFDGVYGESVQLRRVDRIDPNDYGETDIEMPWLQALRQRLQARRLHTLNNVGSWVAVDYRPPQSAVPIWSPGDVVG